MIRRVRICIWRGGFFFGFLILGFWVLGAVFFMLFPCVVFFAVFFVSFSLLFSLGHFLCATVFFALFSLDRCFSAVFFALFSSSRLFLHFLLLSLFVFIELFSSRLCLFLPDSRLANVILLFYHFFFFGFLGFLWAVFLVLLSFCCFIRAVFFGPFSLFSSSLLLCLASSFVLFAPFSSRLCFFLPRVLALLTLFFAPDYH